MEITKYSHAALVIEENGKRLVIDPGNYSEDLTKTKDVVAIVVTHAHDDHCGEEQLRGLVKTNPEVKLFGTSEVAKRLPELNITTVYHGDFYEVEHFTLEFFGDLHQEIHHSIPLIQNTAVMVNDSLYYAGDSYTPPDKKVEILACPTSAPWLRIGDVMDYLTVVRPQKCFPTHNALLSDKGHSLQNGRVKQVVESFGGEFRYLEPGQSWQL